MAIMPRESRLDLRGIFLSGECSLTLQTAAVQRHSEASSGSGPKKEVQLHLPEAVRVVEAFIGEYASGKSELAINRALELRQIKESVTLVDLDIVEPFYTLRPLRELLQQKGLTVVAWGKEDAFGLGETGSLVNPAARWVMRRTGDIIMDVGYGVHGAAALNLVEGAMESPELKVWTVINVGRPMTSTVADIVDYVRSLKRVDGLINNTHLGDETTIEFIQQGLKIITESAQILGVPLVYTAVDEKLEKHVLASALGRSEVKFIHRYMPKARW